MKQITLNGTWHMHQWGKAETFTAQVPGSVLAALLSAGRISDPYYRRNEYPTRELFREDYIFERTVVLSEDFLQEQNIFLVCEGLDTLADIFINGDKVFHADNMHRTWRIPVKEYLHPGDNDIRIEFLSVLRYIDAYKYAENKEVHYIPCGCMKGNHLVRKAHSMFGWDWGPQLIDAGIFRNIYLEGWTERRIEEVKIHQCHDHGQVSLDVQIIIAGHEADHNHQGQKLHLMLKEKDTNTMVEDICLGIREEKTHKYTFAVQNPHLWWPNGYGDQPLYELIAELIDEKGEIQQTVTKTLGLRTLTVSREKDEWGREFAFEVNGVKIFAMGANYIPEDCIYSRITAERQRQLLEDAVRAHFNCIRVWGGGSYPSDAFYELCDELGLIVWQDLMFACNVYDATDAFLQNCRREIEDNVKRLRHHPCLGLWCGNNEIESAWSHWPDFQKENMYLRADYIKLFEQVVPEVMKVCAGDTFYWPSSPSSGGCMANPDDEHNGDAHYWDVWHGQKPFTDYRKYYFRFCSEFGFQSFPSMKTIETFTLPEDRNIFSRVMESHQKNDAANGKILYYISENFRYPKDFDSLLYVSQILQGMAIQYGVEHWRRHRGRCMGALYWQLNDNWPVASWSSIDYFGRWKALQYMARRFFAPVTASLLYTDGGAELFVENETKDSVSWQAELMLKNMKCTLLKRVQAEGSTKAFSSEKILAEDILALRDASDPAWEEKVFVEGVVRFADGSSVKLTETLLPWKYLQLQPAQIEVEASENKDGYELCLSSPVFVPFVELDIHDADVIFSDNYFHLTGQSCTVILKKTDIRQGSIAGAEDLKKRLRVRSLRDTY